MTDSDSSAPNTRRGVRIALGILQVFIGLGGVAGGVGMVSDPSGGNVGMSTAALADSPFSDYLVPGMVLLTVNGFGSLLGAMMTFPGRRRYGRIAVALGLFLMAWIVAQVSWIGLVHWLQPLYFVLGGVELGLGLHLSAKATRAGT